MNPCQTPIPCRKFSSTCGCTIIRCSPFQGENNGAVEILVDLENSTVPVHTYVLTIHPQFTWHLQRQLYDGLHDYFIEMFTRTPQDRAVSRSPMPAGEGSQGS